MEELSRALAVLKEMLQELEHKPLYKYVFVPLLNNVIYEYKEPILTLRSKDNTIKIKILGDKHITKIKENNGRIKINNILVLLGYAIDENSLGLVRTLDRCDYVKGILVNGEIEQIGEIKQSEYNPSIQVISFSKAEVMNKLYFIRKSKVDLQNDIIKINLITESKQVGKTNYRSLNIGNKNEIEEFKKKIEGIAKLYDIPNEAIDNLVEKLSDIINYYSI
jgi:hypothetical protein